VASIRRQLAARLAAGLGIDRDRAELLLAGLCDELLRAANADLKAGAGGSLDMPATGRLRSKASRRGHASGMSKAGAAGAHWAFYFRPYAALAKRCREICAGRTGA
jgi:hypothetical protein